MSPGMKFRRSCNSCNITFFAEDRRAFLCPKCVKKKASTPAPVSKPVYNKPSNFTQPTSYNPKTSSNTFATVTNKTFPQKPPQKRFIKSNKPKQRIVRQPKISVLTEELREKIIAVYNANKDVFDTTKKLHAKISHDVWVKPKLVADTINQLRKQEKAAINHCTLSDEDRARVLEVYLSLIKENIRPVEGRRSYIANTLSLPHQEVIFAVREWSNTIMGQLSRQQLFLIEKEYWRIITKEKQLKFADLPKTISQNLEFVSFEQSCRWLDQLHDNTKLVNVPEVDEEKQKQIIKAYQEYLNQPEPPPQALHTTFAKAFGVKALQVHKVLCEYRCQLKPN